MMGMESVMQYFDTCPNCSADVPPLARFCRRCGMELSRRGRRPGRIRTRIGGIPVILLVFCGFLFFGKVVTVVPPRPQIIDRPQHVDTNFFQPPHPARPATPDQSTGN